MTSSLAPAASPSHTPARPSPASSAKGKGKAAKHQLPSTLSPSTGSPSSTSRPTPSSTKKDKRRAAPSSREDGPSTSAPTEDVAELEQLDEWTCSVIASSSAPKLPPVFTKDASHFFLAVSSTIRVHSSLTSQPISTLSTPDNGHSAPITAYLVNPDNALQLVTASLDGTIKIWDFLDASLLRTVPCPGPVSHLCVASNAAGKSTWFAAIDIKEKSKKSDTRGHAGPQSGIWRIDIASVNPPKVVHRPSDPSSSLPALGHYRLGKIRHASTLMITSSGRYLVALAGPKAYCISTVDLTVGFNKFVSPEVLTCGAFHPFEDWFTTGDAKGIVRLWYCLGDVGKAKAPQGEVMVDDEQGRSKAAVMGLRKTPTTTLHWHAHAVSAVAFNSSGTSILSAGEEATLVVWSVATSAKEFAPRLGGPLVSIGVRPPAEGREEEIWVGLDDGSVKRLGGDGRGGRTITGGYESSRIVPVSSSSSPMVYHAPTSSIILPSSHPSSLQFFSPILQSSLLELEVSSSNRVSRTDDKTVEPAHVDLASVSAGPQAEWLATAESWDADEDEGGAEERNIKVWRWDETARTYILSTRIPNPHASTVSSLAFSPVPLSLNAADKQPTRLLLSTGLDGSARVWRERRVRYKGGRIEASFQPHTLTSHRNLPIHGSSWSPDATLFALAQGSVVTVWDSITSELRGTLSCPGFGSAIEKVEFLGPEGRYLVGQGGKTGVVVWDLLSGVVQWSLPDLASELVAFDHAAVSIIVGAVSTAPAPSSTTFTTFHAISSSPIETRFVPHRIRSLAPYPSTPSSSFCVLAISTTSEVLVLGSTPTSKSGSFPQAIALGPSSSANQVGRTLFDEIFGSPSIVAPSVAAPVSTVRRTKWRSMDELFDAPAQVLPAMSMILSEVLDSLFPLRSAAAPEEDTVLKEDDDMDVDGALDSVRSPFAVKIVQERDVEELCGLFKDILSAPAPAPPPPAPSSAAKASPAVVGPSKVNGSATPVKTPLRSGSAPRQSTRREELVDTPLSTAEVATSSGGGRKRKA